MQLFILLGLAILLPTLVYYILGRLKNPTIIYRPNQYVIFGILFLLLMLRVTGVIPYVENFEQLLTVAQNSFSYGLIIEVCFSVFFGLVTILGKRLFDFKPPTSKPKKEYLVISVISLLLALSLFTAASYITHNFGKVTFSQLMFNLLAPIKGVSTDQFAMVLLNPVVNVILTWGISFMFLNLASDVIYEHKVIIKVNTWRKLWCIINVILLIVSFLTFLNTFGFTTFVQEYINKSSFIEDNYVSPNNVNVTLNGKKQNLIRIYMESGENSFADKQNGGAFEQNAIPELTELAHEGISFSNKTNPNELGGAYCIDGTNWTIAGITAEETGLPLKTYGLERNSYGTTGNFLPGAISLGEMLKAAGYNNYFMIGSDKKFAGRNVYYETHGDYNIYDVNDMRNDGLIPQDYNVNWGAEDSKLFEFAKPRLTEVANQTEPFNFTLLTTDTHAPEGYYEEGQPDVLGNHYLNSAYYGQKQIYDFVRWCQQQPWYEDTTIVITGDHISMNEHTMGVLDPNYERTIYNVILNSCIDAPENLRINRPSLQFDYFPTTLASLGFEIEGNRLGLGTNLFSELPTLVQQYGLSQISWDISSYSTYYVSHFLKPKEDITYDAARMIING